MLKKLALASAIGLIGCSSVSGQMYLGWKEYEPKSHFKAFAANSGHSGASSFSWAYAANRPSAEDAVHDALYRCNEGGKKYNVGPSRILFVGNINVEESGKIVEQLVKDYQANPAAFDT